MPTKNPKVKERLEGYPERQAEREKRNRHRRIVRAVGVERRKGQLSKYLTAKQRLDAMNVAFTEIPGMGVKCIQVITGQKLFFDQRTDYFIGHERAPVRKQSAGEGQPALLD